jgi:hypothetical protein
LPIFQLWRDLIKKGRKNPKLRPIITKVLNDLDYLKALRCEGLEPPLQGKMKYKPGG